MCPTCSATMAMLGKTEAGIIYYWCSRCGALSAKCGEDNWSNCAPSLVERCRRFELLLTEYNSVKLCDKWHILGIREAINVPEDR